ncbi:MAG: hypothetical protein ACFFG0_41645 [Candidatus Thorarchaeota archaeon]
MAKEKKCETCILNLGTGCEIENKEGFKRGGCGAWIERKEIE